MTSRYHEVYAAARADPDAFWRSAAELIDWEHFPQRIFDPDAGVYGRWFVDGVCNTCYNCLDRHVAAGRGDAMALIYDSAMTGTVQKFSFRTMLDRVAVLAAVLQDFGVEKGDRVLIYMPMIPEAVFAMLACARIGAIHSVVFGGFAAPELARRIDDTKPKLLLAASCGLEPSRIVAYAPLFNEALALATHPIEACLVYQRPQCVADLQSGRDHDWETLCGDAAASGRSAACVFVAATHPLYLLYTSGTTGSPKGVVRDNGGHMVALAWSMPNIYGVKAEEVFWSASDIGWVVGHSYIVYAPLLNGSTSVLYEGKPVGTPNAGVFWRVIADHRVTVLFTAPTAFRSIKREDPDGRYIADYDLSAFRTLFLAGEHTDSETLSWAQRHLGIPVINHWWQTETGAPAIANPVGLGALPVKAGSSGVAMPGYTVDILDDDGKPVPFGTTGSMVLRLPLPPAGMPTLWHADERFRSTYLDRFPGYYQTADAGYQDEEGYVYVMSRTDDIINVAGHRLSTGALEEVVAMHPDVAEGIVVGVADTLKGQVPLALVVLNRTAGDDFARISGEIITLVREHIGPVAALKRVAMVPRLPKTRSGKILRSVVRDIADGRVYKAPATIDEPAILDDIAAVLKNYRS